jgi:hypothetical protein
MKRVIAISIMVLIYSMTICAQFMGHKGHDYYYWKDRHEYYSFKNMLKQTENNSEAHKIMQRAKSFNNASAISAIGGMGGALISVAISRRKEPETDPNHFTYFPPSTTFSDVAPAIICMGVACTSFIWRGLAVKNLKKAVQLEDNSAKLDLMILPNKIGFLVTF